MKKKIWIGLIILLAICLTGCGSKDQATTDNKEEKYSLTYKEKTITVGDEFTEDIIDGEPTISELPNCAFPTADQVYTYDDLEIVPATVNDKEVVYSVYFITDEPSTAEGIKLGDSLDDVLNKYGEEYDQPLNNKYVYTKNNTELAFIIENESVTAIEYTLLTE